MDLLDRVMDFKTVDTFGVVLETRLTLVLVNLNGIGGAWALRGPIDSNRSFPVMSTFNIVLAALETFRQGPTLNLVFLALGWGSKLVVG